jgi:hypothetical protein
MKLIVSLLTAAVLLAACGGNQPSTTSASPRAQTTAGSPEAGGGASGDDCKLISKTDIEAIVATEVEVTEGSCSFKATNQSGLNGKWSTDRWSAAGWEGVKGAIGGESHPGIGDEAYSKDSGGIAQIAVKKGQRQLILTVGDPGGKARDMMVKLAEKIVAEM